MTWVSKFLSNNPRRAKQRKGKSDFKPRNPYQAVTIYSTALKPCSAAQALAGKAFLARSAPTLPLAGCTNPGGCHCRYRYHEDRRMDVRRDADAGLPNHGPIKDERRYRPDRRRAS